MSCEFRSPKYRLLENNNNNNNKFFFCKSQKKIVFFKESFFGFVSSPKRSPFFWSCEFTRSINGLLENNNNNNNKILFFASPKNTFFSFFQGVLFPVLWVARPKNGLLERNKNKKKGLGEKINPSKILKWNHNRNWIFLKKINPILVLN